MLLPPFVNMCRKTWLASSLIVSALGCQGRVVAGEDETGDMRGVISPVMSGYPIETWVMEPVFNRARISPEVLSYP